jgi:DNA-damage-inducible protein J
MGLSISDAIRLLMLRIADEQRLPFAVEVPNTESHKAMKELEAGKCRRARTASQMFKDLDL